MAPAETAPAMIMQLQTGAVDFICTDMPTAIGAAAQDDNLVILNFSGTPGDFQFASEAERAENVNIGISVRKGNTVLKDAIDKRPLPDDGGRLQPAHGRSHPHPAGGLTVRPRLRRGQIKSERRLPRG